VNQFEEVPNERFQKDLKLVSLGIYLTSANRLFDVVSYHFLANHFELDESQVKNICSEFINGHFPLFNFNSFLKASIIGEESYLKFETIDLQSSLVKFANIILQSLPKNP
jgi:hypothetical protein